MKFLLLLATISMVHGQVRQVADLYTGINSGGSFVFYQDTCANLQACGGNWDNRFYSACVFGIWTFFQDPNFNPTANPNLGAEYFWGNGFCDNFVYGGRHSSLRYAGDLYNDQTATFNLFQHNYFQGVKITVSGDVLVIDGLSSSSSSAIITGTSDWTVYSGSSYTGTRQCLAAGAGGNPVFWTNLPFPTIGSIRKGCFTKTRTSGGFVPSEHGHGFIPEPKVVVEENKSKPAERKQKPGTNLGNGHMDSP